MKYITATVALLLSVVGSAQTSGNKLHSCPYRITLELVAQQGRRVYLLDGVTYPKYPLDIVGAIVNRCPDTKRMDIIVDSTLSFDDVMTAWSGSGKNQIDQVLFFIKKNSMLYPLTLGEPKPPASSQ